MYIAFKYLVTLVVCMWLVLCVTEYITKYQHSKQGSYLSKCLYSKEFENSTDKAKRRTHPPKLRGKYRDFQQESFSILQYYIVFLGVLSVITYHKKYEIFTYTKQMVLKYDTVSLKLQLKENLKKLKQSVPKTTVSIKDKLKTWREELSYYMNNTREQTLQKLNLLLLKKMTKLKEERDNLAQLLVAAVHANKTIRSQYKLETLAKNRLVRHVESTQKEIKENRAKYVNFQQLYVMTHQENLFLKAHLKKLNKDKDESTKKLMHLITEIYRSDNNALKTLCSNLLVREKGDSASGVDVNLSDVVQQPRGPSTSSSNWQINETYAEVNLTKSWPSTRVIEIMPQEENLLFLKGNEPKLRGLPGEYVWTVKDKDGLIEKVYEYDYGFNFDTNETMQRIREYSVYHDKDCLLDNSTAIMSDPNNDVDVSNILSAGVVSPVRFAGAAVVCPPRRKFLTSSVAFKRFLENNNPVVRHQGPRTRTPLSLCD